MGALATGLFATVAVNAAGFDGLFHGNAIQLGKQALGVLATGGFAFVGTLILGKIIDKTIGLRVTEVEEVVGLDLSQHGERAYGGIK